MSKTKKNDRMTMTIIALLIILLIAAVMLAVTNGVSMGSVSTYNTTITQQKILEDGSFKNVTASFSVEVEGTQVSKSDVEAVLFETMESFTYEEFTGDNAMENLKASSKAVLSRQFGDANIKSIYITDYNTNAKSTDYGASTESIERRNSIMKGLFQNMN